MVSATKNLAVLSAKSAKPSPTEHFLARRIAWLRVSVAGSFLLEMVLSWRLWSSPRTFPKLPLFGIFPATPLYLDISIFIVLLGLLVVIIFHSRPRVFVYPFLTIVAFLAVADQLRWQPFFYQYYFILAALGFFAWSRADKKGRGQHLALTTCRWMVASFYFYAGLQKVNPRFVSDMFPWFVKPITDVFPEAQPLLVASSFLVPFLEIAIGVGLLVKGYRTFAIVLACATHLFILLMLGPLGHNWGTIVWPWNVTMTLLVFILFWRVEQFPVTPLTVTPLTVKEHLLQKSLLIPFVVMPLFSFFNLWDSSLSATMYSGTGNTAHLLISKTVQKQLPNTVQAYLIRQNDKFLVDYVAWSFDELGDTPPAETRIFKGLARSLCTHARQPSDVTLLVYGKPTLFRADKPVAYSCTDVSH
jgi:uncharacterized membrane protein YphA (DoxX/SURF4 family)